MTDLVSHTGYFCAIRNGVKCIDAGAVWFLVLKELVEKMFHENFNSHENEYNAAKQLGAAFISAAKQTADFYAKEAANKCRHADEKNGMNDTDLQESKGNADGQSVNARCNCERNHCFYAEIIIDMRIILIAGFTDHIYAYESKQGKRNVWCNGCHKRFKLGTEQIAS